MERESRCRNDPVANRRREEDPGPIAREEVRLLARAPIRSPSNDH